MSKKRWVGLVGGIAVVIGLVVALYYSQSGVTTKSRTEPRPVVDLNSKQYMCTLAPSVDLYSADVKNVAGSQDANKWRSIEGVVAAIQEEVVLVRTMSGDEVRVEFPVDIEQVWATQLAPTHPGVTFSTGDAVCIDYVQSDTQLKDVGPDNVIHAVLSM